MIWRPKTGLFPCRSRRSACRRADSTRPGSWPAHWPGSPAAPPGQMPGCCCASDTPAPQSQLKRMARLANVKGAFLVDPLRAAGLDGRRVLLVDDVMTSGASIFTAAEALRQAGAAQVT